MPNPRHTARIEAELVVLEAVRRSHKSLNDFVVDLTPAYRRDVLKFIAKKYNAMLKKSGADGMELPIDGGTHGH